MVWNTAGTKQAETGREYQRTRMTDQSLHFPRWPPSFFSFVKPLVSRQTRSFTGFLACDHFYHFPLYLLIYVVFLDTYNTIRNWNSFLFYPYDLRQPSLSSFLLTWLISPQ